MADTTQVTKTRDNRSKRSFFNAEGKYTPRASTDAIGFKIDILDGDEVVETIEQRLEDFAPEVVNAAALFGFVTSITNTFGGMKGDVQEMVDAANERLGVFLEGDWTGESKSGPRTSHALEAFVELRADGGIETSEERKAKFIADIKADDKMVARLVKEDAAFAAKLAAIKNRAAEKRATELAEKAKGQRSSLLD
jgi:hypothetical protein